MSVTESQPQKRFILPAEYYSSATPEAVLPRWATFGCGGVALFVLVLVFAGGAFLASGGMVQLMDFVFAATLGEMRPMYQKDVTPAQKSAFEAEIETLRKNMREGHVAVPHLDPVLQAMRRATSDSKVTAAEIDEMTAAAKRINHAPPLQRKNT
jgi:hypothetical protein